MVRKRICSLCLAKNNFITRFRLSKFDIIECKKCHLLTRSVIYHKQELEKLYSKKYFSELQKDYFSAGIFQDFDSSLRVKDFRERLDKISQTSGLLRRRLLDIGAGTGIFLKVAKDQGWKVEGVEISQFACRIAKEKFHINLFQGELKNAGLMEKSFDVITAWDVIEHLESPRDLVTKVKKLLKPGGFLVLQTTTADSLLFLLAEMLYKLTLGKIRILAEMAYPVHHANHFDRKNIVKLLKSQGFKVVKKENVEMYYEETSLSKVFLPVLKFIGLIAKMTGKTIEVFVVARKSK